MGLLAAEKYQESYPDTTCIKIEDDPTRLLDIWPGKDVILVDCVRSKTSQDGEIIEFSGIDQLAVQSKDFTTSHNLGLVEIVELGKITGRLPLKLHFFGVVGSSFQIGTAPSEVVGSNLKPLLQKIREQMS